jgi:ribosomal peptide maturation radical SAM protein 1
MKVLFVVMPFAAARPALGVSLLASHCDRMGVAADIDYCSLRLLREIGSADYEYIADHVAAQTIGGDWVFAETLFGKRSEADAAYLESLRVRTFRNDTAASDAERLLWRARGKAEAFIEACLKRIDWTAYDLVGFTTSFAQNVASLSLARRVKAAHPHLTIVFGGANCEDSMGAGLHRAFSFIDFVCSGEADVSFPRLVLALMTGGSTDGIDGIVSRRNGGSHWTSLAPRLVEDLDTIPYPNFDDYFTQYREIFLQSPRSGANILMEASRGCWWGQKHHCTFCGLNGTQMAFRSKSPSRVIDEIESLTERYSATQIAMSDNILDMRFFASVLPVLSTREPRARLFWETKANLQKGQLRLLRRANVMTIQPGIESLSTDVLKLMRKGTSAIQNIQLLKWCSEFGIEVCWNWLYGFPGEEPESYSKVGPVIDAISHLQPPTGFGPIRLDRFSPNYDFAADLGFANVRPDRNYSYVYDLAPEQLAEIAYYFEHDYADGRNPDDYAEKPREQIRRWCSGYKQERLVHVDHEDYVAIWDFREGAARRLTVLCGWERDVYLHCDQHRTRANLEALVGKLGICDELDEWLARLVGQRVLLEIDGSYLSLSCELSASDAKNPIDVRAGETLEQAYF